ncbi:hypothetical protein [Streptomyces rimosus]|uniref:hypothetical protein n=1 Tax=Streptomyces rimosus TaxID=1927 RepID=UPI0037CF6EB5
MRVDPGDRDAHAAILEISYGDVDEAAVIVAISLVSADSSLGMPYGAFVVTVEWYGGAVPCTYVGCRRGNVIPARLQCRFLREIEAVSNAPSTVRELVSLHWLFLEQSAVLATVIADSAGASGT